MLEGKIIVEGLDKKPMDVESLFVYEHDLPPNHRIMHIYDDEVASGRKPDRLTIYVDRENIFQSAYCIRTVQVSSLKSDTRQVNSFILAIWGDEGNECDFFSALPVIFNVASRVHTDKHEIDAGFMENLFTAECGGSLGDWMTASGIDELPQTTDMRGFIYTAVAMLGVVLQSCGGRWCRGVTTSGVAPSQSYMLSDSVAMPYNLFSRDIGCLGEEETLNSVISSIPELNEDLLSIY
ncbi:hypothetical protein IW148_003850 [Coemansia sp. RSA 1199]|nr:hypothetical protein IW148_003850 [Coemansia sp. RSA 1199]